MSHYIQYILPPEQHLNKTDNICTVLRMITLNKFPVPVRFRCGSGKLKLCRYFTIFAIFKNVAHSFEPGKTPSYSASHQAPNYVQRS